eukprot:CAMPEP_0172320620 /NCGR_PEP_ID=MMETSP1058-20130122/40970_1 /TAXON_ID=83371 /ORGANISM="Detonula confervacea, Strain CCMP 353" /LENGTH=455 /DNA_ID=CAMNT_0013035915 /DNA_START=32 /DNA_END=1399 /DNA_ORIENTATION=+
MADTDEGKTCGDSTEDRLKTPQDGNGEAADDVIDDDDNDDGIYINLTVPPGVEPGVDSLTFEYDGNELEVLIPAGSVAGDVLKIQVGVAGDNSASCEGGDNTAGEDGNDANHESKPTTSNLMDELGGVDETSDNKPTSSKNRKRSGGLKNEDDGNLESSIKCDEGDGTHGMVWASGTLLAQALTSSFGLEFLSRMFQFNRSLSKDTKEKSHVNCLELGSGLGVCGLALAHVLASCCNSKSTKDISANILLTDHGEKAIDLLKENIQRNRPPSQCITIAAESLVWGNSVLPANHLRSKNEKFQLILGSDLLYNTQESYEPLLNTIKQHLHPEHGIVILSVRWRKPDLEREFFQRAETDGLKFELWCGDEDFRKRSPCQLNWRDYGNPECESSNEYFCETNVSVAKAKKTIAAVTEEDMESMNDGEYSVFEELQVQIYVGKYNEEDTTSRKRQRTDN